MDDFLFLCGEDLGLIDVERSKSNEGKGEREGRRGGVVETGKRAGGGGRVIEGIGFGEGTDRNGTSDIRSNFNLVAVEERTVNLEEGLRLRLRERVDWVSARSRERKER